MGGHKVDPEADASFGVGVRWEEMGSGGVGFFEESADYGAFVKGFVVRLESRHKAARVELKERLRFVVWADLVFG